MQYFSLNKKIHYKNCFQQFKALKFIIANSFNGNDLYSYINNLNISQEIFLENINEIYSKKGFINLTLILDVHTQKQWDLNNLSFFYLKAAKEGDILNYRKLLSYNIPKNFNDNVKNPLFYAMNNYKIDMVCYLLEESNAQNLKFNQEFYSSLLNDLAEYKNGLYIKTLFKYEFEPHKNDYQALLEVTIKNHLHFEMHYLLNFDIKFNYQQERLFGVILEEGNKTALKFFLRNKIFNIHSSNNYIEKFFNNCEIEAYQYDEDLNNYLLEDLPAIFNRYTPKLEKKLNQIGNQNLTDYFMKELFHLTLEEKVTNKTTKKKVKI